MEQYSHLLISSDPDFVPDPAAIESFFNLLIDSFGFQIVLSPPIQPGYLLLTPSAKPRVGRNPWTGETITIPSFDRTIFKAASEIPSAIKDLHQFTVRLSGKWPSDKAPIHLSTTNHEPFEGELVCFAECNLRPEAVCTSDCWDESHPDQAELAFDDPNGRKQPVGIFTNPWTAESVEVPGAGFARFWVAFEFGKWLFPELMDGFNLLQPQLFNEIEQCFDVPFIQAGRMI